MWILVPAPQMQGSQHGGLGWGHSPVLSCFLSLFSPLEATGARGWLSLSSVRWWKPPGAGGSA